MEQTVGSGTNITERFIIFCRNQRTLKPIEMKI